MYRLWWLPGAITSCLFVSLGLSRSVAGWHCCLYKLALLVNAQIHPVVHVSQLKRHIPALVPVSTDRSSVSTDPKEPTAPVMVVQHAHKAIGGAVSP